MSTIVVSASQPEATVQVVGIPGSQGPPGPAGSTGAAGPQGPAGATGPAGPQGAPGTSNTLFQYTYNANSAPPPSSSQIRSDGTTAAATTHIWVSTIDNTNTDVKAQLLLAQAGQEVYVQKKSDSSCWARYKLTEAPIDSGTYVTYQNVVFDSQGPTAVTGQFAALFGVIFTGEAGPPGPTGPQGPTGPAGPTGATGAQGPAGATGAQGVQGPKGDPGATGATGSQGPPGATGAQGTQGATGATGATGPAGPGVPVGGTTGQVLSKIDATDYHTQWSTPAAGGGVTPLLSNWIVVNGPWTFTSFFIDMPSGHGTAGTPGASDPQPTGGAANWYLRLNAPIDGSLTGTWGVHDVGPGLPGTVYMKWMVDTTVLFNGPIATSSGYLPGTPTTAVVSAPFGRMSFQFNGSAIP